MINRLWILVNTMHDTSGYRPTVLALATSPRRGGNTETLLDRMIEGMKEVGAVVEKIYTPDLNISGCRECNACYKEGRCVVKDDFQILYDEFFTHHRIVLAAPVFFMNMCAQAKLVVDRCQCCWAMKYVVERKPFDEETEKLRKGVLLSCGGTKGKHLFDCIRKTTKYFFDALYMEFWGDLCVPRIDGRGAILSKPEILDEAYELGKRFAVV